LIGRVNVIGKTSRELADELEHAYLDGYLVAPNVSVVIETFRPFFIKGAVKAVGAYDFQFNLSVDEAIAVAGGLTERASKHAWFIIRGQDKQKIKVSPEHSIHPGDIVIIEESLF
jgi:protein involved in polysaccharide export with SLBB domain